MFYDCIESKSVALLLLSLGKNHSLLLHFLSSTAPTVLSNYKFTGITFLDTVNYILFPIWTDPYLIYRRNDSLIINSPE